MDIVSGRWPSQLLGLEWKRYLPKMNDQDAGGVKSILRKSLDELRGAGLRNEAETLVGIWDTCLGGCGFNLSKSEAVEAEQISKFLFFSPDVLQPLLKQVVGKLRDPILRDELRKVASNMDAKRAAC